MFREFTGSQDHDRIATGQVDAGKVIPASQGRPRDWSILVPFFNERDFLADTLASIATQTEPAVVVLIDNGSTDGSGRIAVTECRRLGLPFEMIVERTPGKVAALAAGLARVDTRYVATCDADTWYPADYLMQARLLLERDGCVAAGAYFMSREASPFRHRLEAFHVTAAARVLSAQCHAGGAGQAFRTDALRSAGGFDPARWNYVLEDHEIVHQVMKYGAMRYGARLWCAPSPRKRDRPSIKWTLAERLLYQASIRRNGDWFFTGFLAARLAARRLTSERIRERAFQQLQGYDHVTPYPVCG